MVAYEMASTLINVGLWAYLGALLGLLWGAKMVLAQNLLDKEVRREATRNHVRDFVEGRHSLPSTEEMEADSRLVSSTWEERPVRSSSRPGPLELRLQAAHDRARPVLTRALGCGEGRFQRRRPALLLV